MIEMFKKVVFENYANFNGRARRKEYWMFCLASLIISVILGIIDYMCGTNIIMNGQLGIIRISYSLLVLIPGIALGVRRLHDVGKSGWLSLVIFIPLIGALWLLILACTEGEKGPNQYGADPKNEFEDISEIGKE
ncbi:MAG: DUF805 domain-containing protein [Flavobacterium sp.]|nr:MAG: DUF805 domain-containing protein [Flavobacterium sp.]